MESERDKPPLFAVAQATRRGSLSRCWADINEVKKYPRGVRLMDTALLDATIREAPRLLSSLILLLLAWAGGQRLTVKWNLRQKRRELDIATAREFHALYGDFFATWKLWNCYRRDVGAEALPGASRWDLLKRASEAEGRFEAMLVRLSCDRALGPEHQERLGKFRQLYQTLRETIRANKPLPWGSSDDPPYVAFKQLAPQIAALVVAEGTPPASAAESAAALQVITSNKWEKWADELGSEGAAQ